jgi:hypothetical protein
MSLDVTNCPIPKSVCNLADSIYEFLGQNPFYFSYIAVAGAKNLGFLHPNLMPRSIWNRGKFGLNL